MAMATMRTCSSQNHGLPQWKYLLLYCDKLPSISMTCQETNKDSTNTCSTIRFCVYRNKSFFTVHGICLYEERTLCYICSTDLSSVTPRKLYTQK